MPPQKLLTITDLQFSGAFELPQGDSGESTAEFADGVIEVNGDSMFFVGHGHDDAIAEYAVPTVSEMSAASNLLTAGIPKQPFAKVLGRVAGGNIDELDQIVGLEAYKGRLIGNGIEYYDAPADNKQSTFVVEDSGNLSHSPVDGFYTLRGRARAAGWLSGVPDAWKKALGCTHVTGYSSGGPIISRHSVGPSAYCINLDNVIDGNRKRTVETAQMLGFRFDFPLQPDLFNESLRNKLWTHLSQARYGFIVPGTSTYATIGISGGHEKGVGYKIDRGDGKQCGGYCPVDSTDMHNYYWLWDMRDLMRVKDGKLPANWVRPYEVGVFELPLQETSSTNFIGGGSYDDERGLLYLSVLRSNKPPLIISYRLGAG